MNQVTKYEPERMISGILLKCIDGRWTGADGIPPPETLLVIGTTRAIQCWRNQRPIRTYLERDGELPDLDALNTEIPEAEWEEGMDGHPRPPCQLNYVVYLLNSVSADTYTFANWAVGARIAWERLNDKLNWMQAMRGIQAMPLVKLDNGHSRPASAPRCLPSSA
jgi:hypothetical protein